MRNNAVITKTTKTHNDCGQEVCIVKVYFIMNWVQLTDGSELIPKQVVRISDCET